MSLPITKWSIQDRPREKFNTIGRKSLSDAELLAIIIGNGTKNHSALQIAQTLLSTHNHSLNSIKKLDLHQLVQTRGIGKANLPPRQIELRRVSAPALKITPPPGERGVPDYRDH